MIDTNKYEGHTPAPWWMPSMELRGSSEPVVKMATFKREPSLADRTLIVDAPLLLAEVKRLRRAFRIATAHIGFGNHLGHDELRRALNSMGIDYNSLPWAEEEFKDLSVFGGVAHYD